MTDDDLGRLLQDIEQVVTDVQTNPDAALRFYANVMAARLESVFRHAGRAPIDPDRIVAFVNGTLSHPEPRECANCHATMPGSQAAYAAAGGVVDLVCALVIYGDRASEYKIA